MQMRWLFCLLTTFSQHCEPSSRWHSIAYSLSKHCSSKKGLHDHKLLVVCFNLCQGVHLDDPLTPRKSSDAASEAESRLVEDELYPGATSTTHGRLCQSSMSRPDSAPAVSAQFHSACKVSIDIQLSPPKENSSSSLLTRVIRKSKSAQFSSAGARSGNGNRVMSPTDCEKNSTKMCQSDVTNQPVKTAKKTAESIQSSFSNPVSPADKEVGKKSLFSFYLGEHTSSTGGGGNSKGSSAAKTSDPTLVDKAELRRLSSAQEKSRRTRFKKILHPLRRSQSAGNTKDVPAHALFLRHHAEMDQPRRRSQVSVSLPSPGNYLQWLHFAVYFPSKV